MGYRTQRLQNASFPEDSGEQDLIQALGNDALASKAAMALSSKTSLDLDTFSALAALAKAGNEHAIMVRRARMNSYRAQRLQNASFPGDSGEQELIQALDNDALAPKAAMALSSKTSLDLDTFSALAALANTGNEHAMKVRRDRMNAYRAQRLQQASLVYP